MRQILFLSLIGGLFFSSCSDPGTSNKTTTAPPDTVASSVQTDTNDWRSGDSLFTVLGPLDGKVVADMFAGDGYYTWKMLGAGARVLALDDDPANIAALEARKKAANIGDDRLIIRQTTPGITGLMPDEVDIALVTREFSTLGDRKAWFTQLLKGVRSPRTVYIVNFLPQQSPVGPPLSQRMAYNTVLDELNEFGFDDVGVYYRKMPYRYIVFASDPPQSPE